MCVCCNTTYGFVVGYWGGLRSRVTRAATATPLPRRTGEHIARAVCLSGAPFVSPQPRPVLCEEARRSLALADSVMRVPLSPLMLPLVAPSSSLLTAPDHIHLSSEYPNETTPLHSNSSCSRSDMSESEGECGDNKNDLLESIAFSTLYGYQQSVLHILTDSIADTAVLRKIRSSERSFVKGIQTLRQAVPIRIKILLHRALRGITDERAEALIQRAGWTREDFQRGFMEEVSDLSVHFFFFFTAIRFWKLPYDILCYLVTSAY
uniref:Uncharacterized protein n=1 Tax=Ascaris lumbricoides TaxID=6252 RepID=A0A9J2P8F1_ASCLU